MIYQILGTYTTTGVSDCPGEFQSLLYDLIPPSIENLGGMNFESDVSRKRWGKLLEKADDSWMIQFVPCLLNVDYAVETIERRY